MRNETTPRTNTDRPTFFGQLGGFRFRLTPNDDGHRLPLGKQLLYQALCLLIAIIVLYPVVWVLGMSLDARDTLRPTTLFPPALSLQAYERVLTMPTSNPVSFLTLLKNSILLSVSVSLFSVLIAVSAAYVFSRFEFGLRRILMIAVLAVLMMPSIATLAPLFVMLNKVQFNIGDIDFNLRNSLYGVGLAMISGALPFSIWNLKGYLDTIPKDLAEAAMIDGASFNQVFFRVILPLARPALAVTFFLAFLTGWTEFAISWQFLTDPQDFTLSMALWNMAGTQYSGDTPWSAFAAMALILALPVALVYLAFQKQIVGGLTIGGVK